MFPFMESLVHIYVKLVSRTDAHSIKLFWMAASVRKYNISYNIARFLSDETI